MSKRFQPSVYEYLPRGVPLTLNGTSTRIARGLDSWHVDWDLFSFIFF